MDTLKKILVSLESVLVAYSGGVDSAFLLKVANDVLGDNVLAVTAISSTYPAIESENAASLARELGVRHIFITTDEMSDPRFTENSPERCYRCKRNLFTRLTEIAGKNNLAIVVDGSNSNDAKDLLREKKIKNLFALTSV